MNVKDLRSLFGGASNSGAQPAWRMPTDAEGRRRLALACVGLAIIVYAYFISRTCLLGVTGSPSVSAVQWLLVSWGRGADFAHGYIVPFISGWMFYWLWKEKLRGVAWSSSSSGLWVIVAAVLMYWVGVKVTNPRIIAGSAVLLAYGLILYLAGWKWAKELWFPCAFLVFMIPLDFLDPLALKLRMVMTFLSTNILNLFGMDVVQVGTHIESKTHRFEPLDVANPCSGIRSLVALIALSSLYGYVTMDKSWKKWVLFLSSVPLAVLGNLARLVTIVLVTQGFGQDVAMHVYHDYSGYIVFTLAILCMIGLGSAMNLNFQELVHHWTQEEVAPPPPTRRRDEKPSSQKPPSEKPTGDKPTSYQSDTRSQYGAN